VNYAFSPGPGPLRGPFGFICCMFCGQCPQNMQQINLCERCRREFADNSQALLETTGLAIFVQVWYIACMSNQHTVSGHAEEQQHTKERIIAAASKVLAEKGYDATTLREISREAQAAPGLVHYYFGGKDALLVEALQAAGGQFHQRMERLIQQVPADQSLDVFLKQLSERVEQEAEIYRLRYESFSLGLHNPIIAPAVRERLAQRREEIGSVMATVMENLEKTAGVKHSALEPTVLAALLLSVFDGLALQKIMDTSFDLDAAYHLLAQMLRGLLGS
jgi:AcrR family transcriptional regulator